MEIIDYQINISIEPYTGQLRQVTNTFSLEQAEIIAEILSNKREKLAMAICGIPDLAPTPPTPTTPGGEKDASSIN